MTGNLQDSIPGKIDHGTLFGLYTDYENGTSAYYSFVVGCEVSTVDSIPEGFVAKILPASKYAQFTAKGMMPDKVGEVWQHI